MNSRFKAVAYKPNGQKKTICEAVDWEELIEKVYKAGRELLAAGYIEWESIRL